MSSKPILFNTEMVKAILDGRKTQTRRVVASKILNEIHKNDCYIQNGQIYGTCMCQGDPDGSGGYEVDRWEEIYTQSYSHYKVGDILYVRESAKILGYIDCDAHFEIVYQFLSDGKIESLTHDDLINKYKLEDHEFESKYLSKRYIEKLQKIPNGCLKEMARIFLKVTNVKVERLQDISVRDIEKVTGWKREIYSYSNKNKAFFKDYRDFWNSTAKDGYKWEQNPFVFVYEFEKVKDEKKI